MKKILIVLFFIVVGILLVGGSIWNYNRISNEKLDESIGGTPIVKDTDPIVSSGGYLNYTKDVLSDEKINILFFHAKWCVSCKGLNDDIVKNVSMIPSDVNILKVDFDTSTQLKKKYGVTMQHTLVVVDGEGNLIKKLNGLYSVLTLNEILVALVRDGN